MTSSWIARAFATLSPGKKVYSWKPGEHEFLIFDTVDGSDLWRSPFGMLKTRGT